MSSSTSVRVTATTTSSSSYGWSIAYIKTLSGILKIAQLVLGAIVVGISGYYVDKYQGSLPRSAEMYFFVISVTFFIGTFIIFMSYIISFGTSTILSTTIYEFLYNIIAFVLYIAASIVAIVEINDRTGSGTVYDAYMSAGVIGCMVSLLYLTSAVVAYKKYR